MKLQFIAGIAILAALNAAGGWLVRAAHLPVPGSIIGMLLLTAIVETGLLPARHVRAASDFLVRHLALLLVPAGVAIIVHVDAVRDNLLAIGIAAVASLVTVLLVVGVIAQRLERDA